MFRSLRNRLGLLGIELLDLGLFATGVTGTVLALFLGKLFVAAVLAAVSFGMFLRFKRGRVAMRAVDEFVYVNQDGSVRELSSDERQYLSQDFHGSDGGRPYIKASYKAQDGWGSVSEFLSRTQLPREMVVEPVNPTYVPQQFDFRRQAVEDGKRVRDIVTENPDGSVTCSPNPEIPQEKRFELLRQIALERQREREKLAKHPDYI